MQNVLGVKIRGHDTGAALVSSGEVFAISEERLNRIKHSKHIFPNQSIDYCLQLAQVIPEDIDLIVIDQLRDKEKYDMEHIFLDESKTVFPNAKIEVINHHLSHAANAFLCSPFEEAAIMVVDGSGEKIHTPFGNGNEHTSLYYGVGRDIELIRKTINKEGGGVGIGKLYSIITQSVLNFGSLQEGKTMGLASYGDSEVIFKDIPRKRWYKDVHGDFYCNPNITFPGGGQNGRSIWRKTQDFLFLIFNTLREYFAPKEHKSYKPLFEEIKLAYQSLDKKASLPSEYYNNVAATVQKIIEEIFLKISRDLSFITRSKNICLSGGCALNGVSNDIILHDGKFERLFIQPASSDTGIPLGNALWGYHVYFNNKRFYEMRNACLGKEYNEDDIIGAIKEKEELIVFRKSDNVTKETAKNIAKGKIIGWFQGRSEYGPRALGSRSILCDPRKSEMKDILNARVKHREGWRPFAASVLREKVFDYFEFPENKESPFMLFVPKIREEKKKDMSALVHVDQTCRIQSVTQKDNGNYYDLIKEFSSITNVPLILNTSFNLAGEPIVETPEDALKCFLSTEMDFLVMGEYIVEKK